jgi:hypothetical protein
MDDTLLVCMTNRVENLFENSQGLIHGQFAAAFENLVERLAFDVLHNQKRKLIRTLSVQHSNDVLMLESNLNSSFLSEAFPKVRVARKDGIENLDGHLLTDHLILGKVHLPHPAFANFAQNGVAKKFCANEVVHLFSASLQ